MTRREQALFILPGRYPPGGAAARRFQRLARGVQAAGWAPHILGLSRSAAHPPGGAGQLDPWGIPYTLLGDGPVGSGVIRRGVEILRLPWRLRDALRLHVSKVGCRIVIFYGPNWYGYRPSILWCRQHKLATVADLTEWWRPNLRMGHIFLEQECFRRWQLSRLSGVLAISALWEDYARALGLPVLRLPALSELESSTRTPSSLTSSVFTLAYVGQLYRRDLPSTLLAGFRLALARGVQLRLLIIGRTDTWAEGRRFHTAVRRDPLLRSSVHLTGWVDDQEMQRRLEEADAFVLLRRDDWESRACFPTRVPELLLTGRPLIISNVGDVGQYLCNRETAFLLPPEDQERSLANALLHLASDRQEAARIGAAGARAAIDQFSLLSHGSRVSNFFHKLLSTSNSSSES